MSGFIAAMSFFGEITFSCNALECVSMNNQECKFKIRNSTY